MGGDTGEGRDDACPYAVVWHSCSFGRAALKSAPKWRVRFRGDGGGSVAISSAKPLASFIASMFLD